jgi:hypothetical protein
MDGDLDLTGSRTSVFNMSYMELVDRHTGEEPLVHFTPGAGHTHGEPSNDYDEQAPLARGSLLSKLDKFLGKDHCGKEMRWEERYTIYCWIDANVPFHGHYTQKSPAILSDNARKSSSTKWARSRSTQDQPGASTVLRPK